MRRLDIQEGSRFGRWSVVSEVELSERDRRFLCKCDCGKTGRISLGNLRSGHSTSCGCRKRDLTIIRNITHGLCLNPLDKHLFNVWRNMMDRCYRQSHRHYKNWGGRGIKVCDMWSDPQLFVAWAKKGYRPGLTLDREDNDGNYEPSNCRWVTAKEQAQNRRPKTRVAA